MPVEPGTIHRMIALRIQVRMRGCVRDMVEPRGQPIQPSCPEESHQSLETGEISATFERRVSMQPSIISLMMAAAGLMSETTPATWPISQGLAASSICAALGFPSSTVYGSLPFARSSFISEARFCSQSMMYSFFLTRIGRPLKMSVRTVSWTPALSTASLCRAGASPSSEATKRVPTHTALAPSERAIASPLPSEMPPAPTTCIGPPCRGERRPLTMSATAGIRMLVGTSPVCPPPSPPCAQMRSTPASRALGTCLGEPIMFITKMPAACSFSTAQPGGTPTALTKSFAPDSITTSIKAGS
mmetsp:Transcript_56061/g.125171  ORF Transcript_56061/g.125171 Transcript_56061/m.125171 type:complete len:302 (+) Transcript_56061:410-1315(+)